MADTTQTLYLDSIKRLTRSLILKHKATADAQNVYYLQWKGVDYSPELETEWPYYLHLAGQYVPGVDAVMTVISLDTLEEIEFTYDNLLIHRATAAAYTVGSDYYNRLLAAYPDYENLIRGILNPVPVAVSTAADDFTILAWDTSLVEENEYNLIPNLQTWVNAFVHRYYQRRWSVTQDYYDAALIYQLFNQVPMRIGLLRLANCGTQYVHSYHLWAYLGSHGRLNKYRDYVTLKQALTLYRNINYYENNAGKQSTYEELVEVILSERNIPLTAYQIWHNNDEILNDLTPAPEVAKIPQNDVAVQSTGIEKTTVADVLNRELPVARDNVYYYDSQLVNVPEKVRHNYTSTVATKVLDSQMIDYTDATPVKLIDTIYNEWIYLTCDNRYVAAVTIENPATQELLSLTAKEALILWVYAQLRSYDIIPTVIPTVWAQGVMRTSAPSYLELKNNTDVNYVSDVMILLALSEFTPVGTIQAIETFYQTCVQIQGNRLAHRILYSTQEDLYTRGLLEGVTLRFYMDQLCTLVDDPTETFDQWLTAHQLDFSSFDAADMGTFADDLFAAATGMNLKNVASLSEIQQAMIGIMSQLSAYSVQFLREINEGPFMVPDNLSIRFTRTGEAGDTNLKIDVGIRFDEEVDERGRSYAQTEMIRAVDLTNVTLRAKVRASLFKGIDFYSDGKNHTSEQIYFPGARFTLKLEPTIPDVMTTGQLDGLALKYIYANPITDNLVESQLDGLDVVLVSPAVTPLSLTALALDGLDVVYQTDAPALADAFPAPVLPGFIPERVLLSQLYPSVRFSGFLPPERSL